MGYSSFCVTDLRGGSAIITPDGYLAGPLYDEAGLLTADIDLGEVASGKQSLHVAGHDEIA